MAGMTVAFGGVMFFIVRPMLARWGVVVWRRGNGEIGLTSLAFLLIVIFLAAIVTSLIGILCHLWRSSWWGRFRASTSFVMPWARRFRDFVMVFFLSIFFTYMDRALTWGRSTRARCGCLPSRLVRWRVAGNSADVRLPPALGMTRDSPCVGSLMEYARADGVDRHQCWAGPGCNSAQRGCMLVLMAVVTTLMTAPLLLPTRRPGILKPPMRGRMPAAPVYVRNHACVMTGLSGNEIYCLHLKNLLPGELVVGNSVYSMGFVGSLGAGAAEHDGGRGDAGDADYS